MKRNDELKQTLLSFLRRQDAPVSTQTLAEAIKQQVTIRTLRRWLQDWEQAAQVVRIGSGRNTGYRYVDTPTVTSSRFEFLHAVPKHRRAALMAQIRDVWTHTSTAIEGNTFTLGDTFNVLEYGLTISGKPLREHEEVLGHAKAIELIYECVRSVKVIDKAFLFDLHRTVQTQRVTDIYKPVGAWKVEPNGCNAINVDQQPVYIEYAHPVDIDTLMADYLASLNAVDSEEVAAENAAAIYARFHMGFVHIHPFWDGNGRMARLLANIPLLKAGLPPLVIDAARRAEYIRVLSHYQMAVGQLTPETGVWIESADLNDFTAFCDSCYAITKSLFCD